MKGGKRRTQRKNKSQKRAQRKNKTQKAGMNGPPMNDRPRLTPIRETPPVNRYRNLLNRLPSASDRNPMGKLSPLSTLPPNPPNIPRKGLPKELTNGLTNGLTKGGKNKRKTKKMKRKTKTKK